MRSSIAWLLVSSAVVAGCGSDASTSGTGGSGGTAGSSAGGAGGEGDSGGGDAVCTDFDDEALTPVDVVFENPHPNAIYVAPIFGCNPQPFVLERANGAELELEPTLCGYKSCEDAQISGNCGDQCGGGWGTRRIEANSSTLYAWPGAVYEEVIMPEACWGSNFDQHAGMCGKVISPVGSYTFVGSAASDCADCVCDANGYCTHDTPLTADLNASTTATLPGTDTVTLVFE
ncbi:MAG: hypothetical protein RIF41_04395 [Polyangiaceae bacterium]